MENLLSPGKVFVIFGPRQVGKTTLLDSFLSKYKYKYRLDSGDNIKTQEVLGSQDFELLKEYAHGYDLIAIDEAQKITNIGQGLKILVDQFPDLRIIATGSSSFKLAGQTGEPLTGRKRTITLFPVSQSELAGLHNPHELRERLEEWLVFGGYPEVLTAQSKSEKTETLNELAQSYLLRDVLELERVKSSKALLTLLRLLAFQVGNEVSLSELAKQIGIDYKTVARYLDLLEKAFVIICVNGFSRNLRKEITKKNKYYFFDNGIRNAIISNFNDLSLRNDTGPLWENFIFIERMKKRHYQRIFANTYFWRTWEGQEVDLLEEREGRIFGYECKWGNKRVGPPSQWTKAYPNASFEVIDRSNYLNFVT